MHECLAWMSWYIKFLFKHFVLFLASGRRETSPVGSPSTCDVEIRGRTFEARPRKSSESNAADLKVQQEGPGEALLRRGVTLRRSNSVDVETKGKCRFVLTKWTSNCFDRFLSECRIFRNVLKWTLKCFDVFWNERIVLSRFKMNLKLFRHVF